MGTAERPRLHQLAGSCCISVERCQFLAHEGADEVTQPGLYAGHGGPPLSLLD
ncbi:hypothetical protein [Comamonas sp. JC664]|uniref:hypothetical protein n=1 Tax=Comamonas sp. JC664 TaxID=2801917 RepID=UPI00174D0D3F|nr:hypothetical protein [Comamonas sp. JC664]MBL0693093.1 hypothetical protein [Comamonas sp. JC664]